MLAKGGDDKLRAAAAKELGAAADPAASADPADAWWDASESQPDVKAKAAIRRHAAALYRTPLPALPSGPRKRQVESRLAALGPPAVPVAGRSAGTATGGPGAAAGPRAGRPRSFVLFKGGAREETLLAAVGRVRVVEPADAAAALPDLRTYAQADVLV